MGLFSDIKSFTYNTFGQFEFASGEIADFEKNATQAGFETTWKYGDKVAGNYGKAIACGLYPNPCATKIITAIPELATYHIPKLAFEGTSHIASKAANWLLNPSAPIDPKSLAGILQKFYLSACDEAAKFSLEATSQVTKKTIEQITNEYAEAAVGSTTASTFKAVDLVGPALFLSLCTNKATRNLFDTLGHIKLLITGSREVREAYTIHSNNSATDMTISRVKHYRSSTLARDIAMEALFTSAWGAGAYFTYNGIHNAVLAAAAESDQAKIVTNAILITGWVAPTVFGWVKGALFTPSIITEENPIEENEVYPDPESLSPGNFGNNVDIINKLRNQ